MFGGIAESAALAWTSAFDVGRAALLTGMLDELAIAVDEARPTVLYSPGRDRHGQLDPETVSFGLNRLLADIRAELALR